MPCDFPEHHGSSGGGPPWALIIAVAAVALLAPLVGVIIHVIALVLTFTGIAALAGGGGWLWWRLSHRQPRVAYQVTPAPWRGVQAASEPRQAIEQHVHHHWHGVTAEQIAEVIERGGQ